MAVLGEGECLDRWARRRLLPVWLAAIGAYDQVEVEDQQVDPGGQAVLLSREPSRAVGGHLQDSRAQAASTHDDHHHRCRRHDPLGPAPEANSWSTKASDGRHVPGEQVDEDVGVGVQAGAQ